MNLEDLKKLSPEERIKILKELEKSKKNEIDEARKLIVQSEGEIEEEAEIRKHVPIPQVKAVNIEGLFSTEEKQLFKATRFVDERRREEPEAVLEEAVKKEEPREHVEQRQYQIRQQITEQTRDIYNRAKQEVEEKGYMSNDTRDDFRDVYERNKQIANAAQSMMEETDAATRMMKSLVDWYKR